MMTPKKIYVELTLGKYFTVSTGDDKVSQKSITYILNSEYLKLKKEIRKKLKKEDCVIYDLAEQCISEFKADCRANQNQKGKR